MDRVAALAFIWLVGILDLRLTTWLVSVEGPDAEMNLVARGLMDRFGIDALFPLKLVPLAFFSITVLVVSRYRPTLTTPLLGGGMFVSAALALWWDFALKA
jgi:hypothetical protein